VFGDEELHDPEPRSYYEIKFALRLK
jgi:hypothetical protein